MSNIKAPNGYGSITKLSGNRRRPWMVRITTGKVVDFERQKSWQKQTVLGYYASQKEAILALAEYNANPYSLDKATTTIGDIWKLIQDKVNVSENRRKVYKSVYKKYISPIENYKVREVHADLLQSVIDSTGHGYSTQSNVRSVLNHIFDHGVISGIIDRNYMEYVKLESQEIQLKRDLYTADEIQNIWDHVGQPEYDLTLLLLYHGTRITEMRELPKEDINLIENTLTIRQAKNEWSKRVIPIHDKMRPIIERLMQTDSKRLTTVTKNQYEHFASTVLHHKGYDARHTFASKANELGIPKLTIQRLMGHKPESVLEQTYIHLKMEELADSLNTIKYLE